MDRTIADLTEYILSPRGRLWPGPNFGAGLDLAFGQCRVGELTGGPPLSVHRTTSRSPGAETSWHAISTMPVALDRATRGLRQSHVAETRRLVNIVSAATTSASARFCARLAKAAAPCS